MKYLFVVVCLFSATTFLAQEQRIIKGEIINGTLKNSVVHIINLTQKTGTITSFRGGFGIIAKENDTLLFSSLLYIPQEVRISSSIHKKGFIKVELIKIVNELEEVNIINIAFSGNLGRDLSPIKTLNKYVWEFHFLQNHYLPRQSED